MSQHNRSSFHQDGLLDVPSHVGLALFWSNITIDVLGIVGNCLTIIVLAHRKIRCSTSILLITMGLYDSVFLLTELTYSLWEVVFNQIETTASAHPTILCIAGTGSVYTAVAVTAERYIAVKHPMRARTHCHLSGVWKTIAGIFVVSLVINLPRLLAMHAFSTDSRDKDTYHLQALWVNETNAKMQEFEVNYTSGHVVKFNETTVFTQTFRPNETSKDLPEFQINETNRFRVMRTVIESDRFESNDTTARLDVPTHRRNATSVIFLDCYDKPLTNTLRFMYCSLFPALFILVFPFAIIIVLNAIIVTNLTQHRRNLTTIMTSFPDKGSSLTRAAIGITSCFFIFCGFPGIYYAVRFHFVKLFGYADQILMNVSYTLIVINFSTNFLLYCFLGKTFRNIFLDLICLKGRHTNTRSGDFSLLRHRSGTRSSQSN